MYEHIGRKIKSVAEWLNVLGVFVSVLLGVIIIGYNEDSFLLGLLVMGVGAIISWLSTLLLCGFGQLVEDTQTIREAITNGNAIGTAHTAASSPSEEKNRETAERTDATCANCGAERADNAVFCTSCGQKFSK